ncbi:efflux RND transporter periplasmic adaptor subunit [Patescibacteria group bacterium]|nr:efflux RND transporter periplasmic adaptor subunit [Patescibacteria group bacterium]
MSITTRFVNAVTYIRKQPWYYSWGGALVIAILLFVGGKALLRSAPSSATSDQTSHVKIASVASLAAQSTGPLPVTGVVTSLNHASISAQSSGEVVALQHKIGDYVSAGTIIGSLENSSQRAAVLQAQGAYNAAQATFTNTSGTGAANSGISAAQAGQAVVNAQTSVNTSLQNLFAALDDAVHTKADPLFSQPRTNPVLQLTVNDNQLVITLQNERQQLDFALNDVSALSRKTTRTNTGTDIAQATTDAQLVVAFLNNLVDALNKSLPSQSITSTDISAYQSAIGSARTSVNAAISGLAGAKSSYDAAVSAAASALNTAQGGTQGNISVAQANVEQAQGVLAAARASLEKTIIRSPISGTIVSLPISQGDYVSNSQYLAEISNPSALEVDVYVTPEDSKTLAVGSGALIAGAVQGTVVSIAPALDPTTGKILVKVGIIGSPSALTDGETVTVSLSRATAAQTKKVSTVSNSSIMIPIVAAKITPSGPIVFSVSASSTLTQIPITLGTILGDKVIVLSGLTPDMVIVEDARGLSNGQQVIVDSH